MIVVGCVYNQSLMPYALQQLEPLQSKVQTLLVLCLTITVKDCK